MLEDLVTPREDGFDLPAPQQFVELCLERRAGQPLEPFYELPVVLRGELGVHP